MAGLPQFRSFDDLLRQAREPGAVVKAAVPEEYDSLSAADLGYRIPKGWKVRRTTIEGMANDTLVSPRGVDFQNVKPSGTGRVASFDAFREGKPINLSGLGFGAKSLPESPPEQSDQQTKVRQAMAPAPVFGITSEGKQFKPTESPFPVRPEVVGPAAPPMRNTRPLEYQTLPGASPEARVRAAIEPTGLREAERQFPTLELTTPGGKTFQWQPSQAELDLMTPAERIRYQESPQEWLAEKPQWAKQRRLSASVGAVGENIFPVTADTTGWQQAWQYGVMTPEQAKEAILDQLGAALQMELNILPLPSAKPAAQFATRMLDRFNPIVAGELRLLGNRVTTSTAFQATDRILHSRVWGEALADERGALGRKAAYTQTEKGQQYGGRSEPLKPLTRQESVELARLRRQESRNNYQTLPEVQQRIDELSQREAISPAMSERPVGPASQAQHGPWYKPGRPRYASKRTVPDFAVKPKVEGVPELSAETRAAIKARYPTMPDDYIDMMPDSEIQRTLAQPVAEATGQAAPTAPPSPLAAETGGPPPEAGTGQPPAGGVPPGAAPPPLSPTPPGPPVLGGHRGLYMDDLQDTAELVETMTKPDVYRRIANLPGVRSVMKFLNPAGVANRPAEQAVIARAALREEGTNKAIGAFSNLERLGNRQTVWGKIDDAGRISQGPLTGKSLDEVLTYRKKYYDQMTAAQKGWADQFNALEVDKLDLLRRNGIEINKLSFAEGGEYVGRRGRRVVGMVDNAGNLADAAYVGAGPGRPGTKQPFEKTRVFANIEDALAAGFRYLPPDVALFLNIKGAYNRIADKQMADWLLARIPWRTAAAPETLMVGRDLARGKLAASLRLRSLLNRAVRGERVTVDAALSQQLSAEAQELRDLVPLLQQGAPVADRVKALTKRLNDAVAQNKQDLRTAAQILTKAQEKARRGAFGEATVEAPAFAGKVLTGSDARETADVLRQAFDAQYGDVDRVLNAVDKVNAIGRYFALAGDASNLMIQLIGLPFRHPIAWAKSAGNFGKALFSDTAHAAYLAKNNDIIQKSRNLILSKGGQTEYTEAFRSGGLLSKGPAKLLNPFQRAFEASMDTAGVEMRKAMDHLADTPQHIAEVEQFINEFRGVTSSARIGVSPHMRRAEAAVFLAPRYNRAVAALMSDVLRGGIRGDQARKAMLALAGGVIAAAVAVTLARGEGWDRVKDHLDQRSKDFMTWEVAGQRVGPGSKFRSFLAYLGKITNQPGKLVEHTSQYVRGNFSPLLSAGIDIIGGKDYIGDPTRPGPGVDVGRGMLALTKRVVGENLIPLWAQSLLMEQGTVGERATRGAIEFSGGRAYSSPNQEAIEKVAGYFGQMGQPDARKLDDALDRAKKEGASAAKISEIKNRIYLYDVQSIFSDVGKAIQYIDPNYLSEKQGFNALVPYYVEFKKQHDAYNALSAGEQRAHLQKDAEFIARQYFVGEWSNFNPDSHDAQYNLVSAETVSRVASLAEQYDIPLELIPAFQPDTDGTERFPSDKSLWRPYFDYYELPGNGGYLSLSKDAVAGGKLPDKYKADWEGYQKLVVKKKTMTTYAGQQAVRKQMDAFRKAHKAASTDMRDEYRHANPGFDKWLREQEGMSPLAAEKPAGAGATGGGGLSTGPVGVGRVSFGGAPKRGKAKAVRFKKASMAMSVGAPRV